jgi:hypothetical protein
MCPCTYAGSIFEMLIKINYICVPIYMSVCFYTLIHKRKHTIIIKELNTMQKAHSATSYTKNIENT